MSTLSSGVNWRESNWGPEVSFVFLRYVYLDRFNGVGNHQVADLASAD